MGRFHFKGAATALAIAVVVQLWTDSPAQAAVAGILDCDVMAGQSVLIGSQRGLTCLYRLSDGGVETYAGTLVDAGFEVGELNAGKVVYNIYTLLPPGKTDLDGAFIGGGIGGSIGLDKGLRVDNLVGGPANAIVLQPESQSSTQATGLNFGLGLRILTLHYVDAAAPIVDQAPVRPNRRHKKRS